MSFSSQLKDEVCKAHLGDVCCAKAEIFGLSLSLEKIENTKMNIITPNSALIRRIVRLLKRIGGENIFFEVNKRAGKSFSYNINYNYDINGNVLKICKNLGVDNLKTYLLSLDNCCMRSVVRGFFLAGGYVSEPEKDYSVQIKFINDNALDIADEILTSFDLKTGRFLKEERYVVYIKEADSIVNLLSIIGAYNALMDIENIRILKEVKNNVNRVVNCENANLEKQVNTSIKQIADIKLIQNTIGLNKLEEKLRIIAQIRLDNKEASLKELGEMLDPSLGKSGVNHRFKRIEKIAQEIKDGKGI